MRRRFLAAIGSAFAALALAAPASAQFSFGYFPPNFNSAYGDRVDRLYFTIFAVVAVMFVITEGLLVYAAWRFRARPGRVASYTHGSKKAEIAWSVLPGGILLWLALAQVSTWKYIKQDFPSEREALVVQALPKQFEWYFRYAGADGRFGTEDDVTTQNSLHVPVGKKVIVKMTSTDVIHSFFIPFARVKQDVVPGMMARAWFQMDRIACWDLREGKTVYLTPQEFDEKRVALRREDLEDSRKGWSVFLDATQANRIGQRPMVSEAPRRGGPAVIRHRGAEQEAPAGEAEVVLHAYDIACAELCGIQHFKMRGWLTVEPQGRFEAWLAMKAAAGRTADMARWERLWDTNHPEYNR